MKVLVLGGTQFIGRHVVDQLLSAGHEVTLLNRGKTSPALFPNLKLIKADRESDDLESLSELKQSWDAVIDLSAYYPKGVEHLLEIFKGRVGRYIFCSTVSAYAASAMEGPTLMIDEESPLRLCSAAEAVDSSMASYGQRKAECERVAMKQHERGIPTVILRPSVVYGAHDYTDRFAYWIWRAAQEKPFILPDDGLTITRRTYAPDLATAFVAALKGTKVLGNAYNIAETDPLNFRDTLFWLGQYLETKPLEFAVSISSDDLLREGVKPWADLPLWLPKMNLLIDTFRARRDLSFVATPPEKALAIAADAFLAEKREPQAGLPMNAERELLARLKI